MSGWLAFAGILAGDVEKLLLSKFPIRQGYERLPIQSALGYLRVRRGPVSGGAKASGNIYPHRVSFDWRV